MGNEMMDRSTDITSLQRLLVDIVGEMNVDAGGERCDLVSRDMSRLPTCTAEAVVAPGSIVELQRTVACATGAGFNVVPRGGGMSYTLGYAPALPGTLSIDMSRLNRIEINEDDLCVTVECGCTWKDLFEALQARGLRTPYYGPLSGRHATVGGTLSQNSVFLGSGFWGCAADSVLGLDVVLADGRLLRTGSVVHRSAGAFARHFGPDLTGVFTSDTGAMGFKARATLKLIQEPAATGFVSFGFETLPQMLAAQVELAKMRITAECYGFDPVYNKTFEKLGISFTEGLATILKLARGGASVLDGITTAAKVALIGKRLLRDVNYSLHMVLDAFDEACANSYVEAARQVCRRHGGKELAPNLPRVLRAEPFAPIRRFIHGSDGENFLPIHGMCRLSQAQPIAERIEAYFRERRKVVEDNEIWISYLTAVSGHEFLIEPSFFWRDDLLPLHHTVIEPEYSKKWGAHSPNPVAREAVLGLRRGIRDLFLQHGAYNMQLGKYYPYREAMEDGEPLWDLVNAVKAWLDPECRMNPGSLGLWPPS